MWSICPGQARRPPREDLGALRLELTGIRAEGASGRPERARRPREMQPAGAGRNAPAKTGGTCAWHRGTQPEPGLVLRFPRTRGSPRLPFCACPQAGSVALSGALRAGRSGAPVTTPPRAPSMTDAARAFRGFRFPAEVILWAVRWYRIHRMLWICCNEWSAPSG